MLLSKDMSGKSFLAHPPQNDGPDYIAFDYISY